LFSGCYYIVLFFICLYLNPQYNTSQPVNLEFQVV
jgi:hypothetical protein